MFCVVGMYVLCVFVLFVAVLFDGCVGGYVLCVFVLFVTVLFDVWMCFMCVCIH